MVSTPEQRSVSSDGTCRSTFSSVKVPSMTVAATLDLDREAPRGGVMGKMVIA